MTTLAEGRLKSGDIKLLACPACRAALGMESLGGDLGCSGCGARWPLSEGFPRLYREAEVRGTDRLMRVLYNAVPAQAVTSMGKIY